MALTGRELRRVQNRVLLLVKSAEQRVAGFLLEMAERARSANVVELPRRAFPSPGWRWVPRPVGLCPLSTGRDLPNVRKLKPGNDSERHLNKKRVASSAATRPNHCWKFSSG
jgi:hypothetical protein